MHFKFKKTKAILLVLLFVFIFTNSYSQEFLNNLPKNKSKSELTLFDYRQAFDSYWAPYNVNNGYYIDGNGNKQKAAYWKQFNRWYYDMEKRVKQSTGEFPTTSAAEQLETWKNSKPKGNNSKQGFLSGPLYSSSWTSVGPSSSGGGYSGTGRLNCVAFHPSNNNTFWVGSPSGGLWVTTNGGTNWSALTDNNSVLGVSDIGIPGDFATSNTIYIATGDRDGGSMWSLGGGQGNDNNSIGVLKSTDGGSTWSTTGLTYAVSQKKILSKILVHPSTSSTLYVAGTDGILKSTDGGTTWTNIYNTNNNNVAVYDLEFKPGDPTTIYASTKDYSGAPLILVSTNSGSSWTAAATLATGDYRIELAVSPANSAYVYAVVATRTGGLKGIYKSTNSGVSYSVVYDGTATNHNLLSSYTDGSGGTSGQGGYDLALAVSNTNINEVYVAGIITHKSTDGGASWTAVNCWTSYYVYNKNGAAEVHADHHMLKLRPSDGALFEVNDGGVYNTTNSGSTWTHLTGDLVISQLYRLSAAQATAGELLAGLQDNGTKLYTSSTWYDVKGGDGMDCQINPSNTNNQYGAYVNGQITRTTDHWSSTTNIEPSAAGSGAWMTPYVIDPNNNNTLYAGYADIYKSTDQGNNWTNISSVNTSSKIRAIAVAPSNSNYIYFSDPNQIWATTNGGTSWTDITGSLPVSTNAITYIAVKANDPTTIWVTFGGYDADRIYETTNGGTSWTNISSGLPNLPVMCVIQNSLNSNVEELYVGTDVGIYMKDGSSNWVSYNIGLPNVVVNDLDIYYDNTTPANSKLYAGTSGRGVWTSPLNSTGCTTPTTQASNFSSSNITSTSMDISWTRGNGDNVMILAHENAAVDANPSAGSYYSANSTFGIGDEIGTGNFVVYSGSNTSVNTSGLTSGATLYYALYEYNNTDSCYLNPALTGSQTTNGPPSVTTTAASSITGTSASSGGDVTSLNGYSLTHKGVCWSTSHNPTLSDSHTDDIAQGTGTGTYTSSITGLSGLTTYYVRAYATNSSGTNYGNEESFVTDCGQITAFPFIESFENSLCWYLGQVTGSSSSWSYASGSSAYDGNRMVKFNSSGANANDQSRLFYNNIDISNLSKIIVSFWLYHETSNSTINDNIQLQVYSSGTWTSVGSPISRYNGTTGWTRYAVDISNYPSATAFGFLGTSGGNGSDINIDYVKIFDSKKNTNGKLTKCSPYFVRNGGTGSLYFYDQYDFTVEYDGVFNITADWTTVTNFDGYLYLYSTSFDPLNPATNLIASNDDYGSVDFSKIANQALSSATNYIIVATTKNANNIGSNFSISIDGSAAITANSTADYNGIPSIMAHSVPNTDGTTRVSDYECDDSNSWTHYYDDNGTSADYSDDNLLLSVKKNSNNLGATTVRIAGSAGASKISSSNAPYVSSFGGWFVYNRYWILTPTNQPTTDVNIRYYYNESDFTSLNTALSNDGRNTVANKTDLSFVKINNLNSSSYDPNPANGHIGIPKATSYDADGAWIYDNGQSAGTDKWMSGTYGSAFYAECVVSHFSGGGGGAAGNAYDGSLPIELLNFIGYADSDVNKLEWKTATEFNADYFIIERKSIENDDIDTIGTVKANGNSNTIQEYSLTDLNPLSTAYYRLINVNYDGDKKEYDWILVHRDAPELKVVRLYPNPTINGINLEFINPNYGNLRIEVRDVVSRVVKAFDYKMDKGLQRIELDLSKLEAGTYYLSIDNSKNRIVNIIIKE